MCGALRDHSSNYPERGFSTDVVNEKAVSIIVVRHARSSVMVVLCAVTACLALGCRTYCNVPETIGNHTDCIDALMSEVDAGAPATQLPAIPPPPLTLRTPEEYDRVAYRDMTLEEAIQVALNQLRTCCVILGPSFCGRHS